MEVKVTNATKSFDAVAALNGLNFQVKEGEFVAVLGPSSAGKTTMLRAISGLESLDEGQIEVNGNDTNGPQI